MTKQKLTGNAFQNALAKENGPVLRKFVSISKLLVLLHEEQRALVAKALGTTLEDIAQWDMTFETRRKIEAILGCEWEQVTPASIPAEVKNQLTNTKRRQAIESRQELLVEADELIGTFPIFKGQKRIKTLHASRFNTDYLVFLQGLLEQCTNDAQRKALMKREGHDLGKMTETLKRLKK